MDGAFFSDEIVGRLYDEGVRFRRFLELKLWTEGRWFWHRINV